MSDIDSANGVRGGYDGNNYAVKVTFTTFLVIALYNSIELVILIFSTFKHYRGLYFWSLMVSVVLGVIPQSISFILKYYSLAPLWFTLTFSTIGWYFMVTGQAVVLYSRLNLVVHNPKVLHRVLVMIVFNAICLQIPTTVLTYGSNFSTKPAYINGYGVMERIQLIGFSLQEFIISGLYILETVKMVRLDMETFDQPHRSTNILYQLIGINLLIIMLDIVLLTVEFLNLFVIQTTLKPMVYSIKLKLELAVLGRLVVLVRSHRLSTSGA
ncbi:hypothetical protein N7510_009492 [Penicillium lagena]|uniref:uncharacterized protein n=1 Tax=Penicillium lagena TaxID=94218 RepID=UPI00253F94A4|nr:uncharacterized protein N7510_009492 [Penicillium lagena]KAJ5604338.1 hypothetical protein N7510_009492 [Penicillium lagena]